jgi:hypothetical protein
MNAPTPPEPRRTGTPPGDRLPDPVAEPVHSLSFKPPLDGAKRQSVKQPKNLRGWVLAGMIVLLVAAGGLILHHLQQHPVIPQVTVPHEQTPETPASPDIAAAPPPIVSGEPESQASQAERAPEAVLPDRSAAPAPVPVLEDEMKREPGRQAPVVEKVAGGNAAQPDPTRKRFRELLSLGLAALHRRQYGEARGTLQKAAAIDPESDEVREALTQVDHALKLAQLDRLQRLATAAEGNGHWSTALEHYLAALTIDPNVGFALRGRQRTMRRITIAKRVDFYLNQPETLFDDRHLSNAVQLMLDAEKVAPQDPDLAANLKKLDQLVTAAQTPVSVTITSDNQTDVVVYKVGRLGRFETHDLRLRPGPYTVVGTRDGYRDVRVNVTVHPGATPPVVHVVCKEEIR